MMGFELKRVDNSNFKTHQSALAMSAMLAALSSASCHPRRGSRPGGTILIPDGKNIAIGLGVFLWEKTGLTLHKHLQHSVVTSFICAHFALNLYCGFMSLD